MQPGTKRELPMFTQSLRAVLLFTYLFIAGCVSHQVHPQEWQGAGHMTEVAVSRIEYTDKGLPLLGPRLAERPSRPGERFTVALNENGRLAASFDIVVAGPGSDLMKPFRAVYAWTGKGYRWGLEQTPVTMNLASQARPSDRKQTLAVLVFSVSPLAVCTAGGFVIGVADGLRTTAGELCKIVVRGTEQIITSTVYVYDTAGRLARMTLLAASTGQELLRAEYSYEGPSTVPRRTTVSRPSEGVVWVVE